MKDHYKKIKTTVCILLSSFFLLYSIHANGLECGVMQLQSNRSSGVITKNNGCDELSYISIGTLFELSAKGRLWLKSTPGKAIESSFQMICQNKTNKNLQLEFSDMVSPWLNQAKLKNCTGWINNQLSCDSFGGDKNAVLCVLSFSKSKKTKTNHVQRTTSVKMRSLQSLLKTSKQTVGNKKIFEAITQELKLCKKLNQVQTELKVNWLVQKGEVSALKVHSTAELNAEAVFDCIETVIKTVNYPSSELAPFKITL